MKFGIVADDNTGASDAAGMLTEKGVPSILFLEPPDAATFCHAAMRFEAAAVATRTRSSTSDDARRTTGAAVRLLCEAGVEKIQLKHCSTFDSTPEGNIGPSLDAAMDALGAAATIVCPALPVNGRTVYAGHLFVNGQLLSESHMKDHPLHPMTDSNLVRWLQYQTKQTVALAPLPVVRRGAQALDEFLRSRIDQGERYFVTDAIEQSDLTIIARATAAWPLITGGSGITSAIPGVMFPNKPALSFSDRLAGYPRTTLVIAGSCSPATRKQNAFALDHGFAGLHLDGVDICEGRLESDAFAAAAQQHLAAGKSVVVTASADPGEVARVQAHGRAIGLFATQVGEQVAEFLAAVAASAMGSGTVGRLIVSGGETAAAVCRRLRIQALEVGLPVDPGAPYCFPVDGPNVVVVLKSGNFGAEEFYLRVQELQQRPMALPGGSCRCRERRTGRWRR